ncbi:MAG TPA: hypothetical protein VKB88_26295 [Bryobacteraceae bacterium]|nr:hypothetical protein [Bryobacteraceae bacterium]
MKPTLGWTMLSREEMRHAERLARGEQDTRDEIGFLLVHQGFADRFFPGNCRRRCVACMQSRRAHMHR